MQHATVVHLVLLLEMAATTSETASANQAIPDSMTVLAYFALSENIRAFSAAQHVQPVLTTHVLTLRAP